MSLLNRALKTPRYGYEKNGLFFRPSISEIFFEFIHGLNIFRSKKNWLALLSWVATLSFLIPLAIFCKFFWNWRLALLGLAYSMIILGSHGTFWFHRYCTHRAFKFRNSFFRNLARNMVIKIVPEEIYVISHHVHHQMAEKAGDPYNVYGGWLYCFLADVNHQAINRELSEKDYNRVSALLRDTGVHVNDFEGYLHWGSLCHPLWTITHYVLNWSFWYAFFFFVGGHALACAIFGFAGVWAVGIRTFNFEGHGKGRDRQRDGIDFHHGDISVNQAWPGLVAGEWHNNHHLYPNSARSGYLYYQLDLPWLFIRGLFKLGVISSFKDSKEEFLKNFYKPYLLNRGQDHNIFAAKVSESLTRLRR
jgi:fatty-acid desaturase